MTEKLDFGQMLKVKRHQVQMLLDRGYNVDQEAWIFKADVKKFKDQYDTEDIDEIRESLTNEYSHSDEKKTCLVQYLPVPSTKQTLGADAIKPVIDKLTNKLVKYTDIIFVTKVDLTSTTYNLLTALKNVQIFYDYEFNYNPTKHVLCAIKNERLTEEEEAKFLKDYNATKTQLPKFSDDRIAKYYGWPKRSIIRITRYNYLNTPVNISISYRCVQ